jgi:putative ABC transport system permease protein
VFCVILADLRYALRTLKKSAVFAATAAGTLALGIGANTAMFSVLDAQLLRPLPFGAADRLVRVAERNDKLSLPDFTASPLNYLSWKEAAQCFDQMGAVGYNSLALTGHDDPEQFDGNMITPSLLALLKMRPIAGREFLEGEDQPGGPPVVMLGEKVWRRRFAADPSIVGQSLTFDGLPRKVVGIMPASFSVISPGDVFTPMVIDRPRENRLAHTITVVARIKPGVSVAQAQAEMDSVAARVGQEYPQVKDWGVRLFTFSDWFVPQPLKTALLVLMGAVGLVLCIACANIASLLLSRGVARQREIGVRMALGASRIDLLRQCLVESVVLSAVGGVAGVALAYSALALMKTLLPPNALPFSDFRIDAAALLFTALGVVGAALAFGLIPAWHTSRLELNSTLKQGGRSGSARHSATHRILAASELTLATVLLISGGLLLESLLRLQSVRPGFDTSHLLTFQLTPPPLRYSTPAVSWGLYERLITALRAMPGVESAAISSGAPFGGGAYTRTPIAPVGTSALAVGQSVPTDWRAVSPGFLQTMKIPLIRGRFISEQDVATAPAVAVVSQKMATTFWGSEDPLGKVVRVVGSGKELLVVGVVGDVLNQTLDQAAIPGLYYSAMQRLWPTMDVVVRTRGVPESAIAEARQVLRELDPSLPLATVKSMDEWIGESVARPRMQAALVGIFGASALLAHEGNRGEDGDGSGGIRGGSIRAWGRNDGGGNRDSGGRRRGGRA